MGGQKFSKGMVIIMDLNLLKSIDVKLVDKDELVERSDVKIEENAPREERLKNYIKQIKNPYCYKDGNTVVKISFSNTTSTLEDCISHYLKGL